MGSISRRKSWAAVLAVALLAGVAGAAGAGPGGAEEPAAPYRLERGPFELGLGVSRLRLGSPDPLGETGPSIGSLRLLDPDIRTYDPRSAAISFDLKVRWPGMGDGTGMAGLQPYLSVGPALLVAEPDYSLLGRRGDSQGDYAMSLGLKGGAGVNWQVDSNVSLFGEYGFTRPAEDRWLPGGRSAGDGLDARGFRYGVKIRF